MAHGVNRAAAQPRAHFREAGGATIVFKHPYLLGQLGESKSTPMLDEIDVSACCKLETRFFEAMPSQDSAQQVVLIDGSTVTITKKILNGVITMPVISTTGLVATGDFIAALHLIKSTGDTVGGLLYITEKANGFAKTKLFYGVTVKSLPDHIAVGNDVAEYNVQLYYTGWIETVSKTTEENLRNIWAVGTEKGISGFYTPYALQNEAGDTGTQEGMLTRDNSHISDAVADSTEDNVKATVDGNTEFEAEGTYGDTQDAGDKVLTVKEVLER